MISGERLTEQQTSIRLKVARRIIGGWEATQMQACRILRISPGTAGRRLDQNQQRIGLVLGIHASLRAVFSSLRYSRRKNAACYAALSTKASQSTIRGTMHLGEENSMTSGERLTEQQTSIGLKVALRIIGGCKAT
ncbi:hypothetical protein ABOC32_13590 [Pseudomonas sp. WOUb67]|uniref:hypothetical protein n=1 Tax=Pseudomonas sp. WOUb67 TaxID=3161136 RepID=UPI003CE87D55